MVKSKLLKPIGVLYKTRYFLNKKFYTFFLIHFFMSHKRYGQSCSGRTNKKVNEINLLINKALSCIYCKKYKESVRNLKVTKKY